MTLRELSVSYALSSSAGALIGLILGGAVVGRIQARSERLALIVCGGLNVAAAAASATAFTVGDNGLSLTMFALFGALSGSSYAPTVAMFQQHAPGNARAVAAAIMMLFVINLGHGGGPFLIGAISDHLTAIQTPNALGTALLVGSAALLLSSLLYGVAAKAVGAPAN